MLEQIQRNHKCTSYQKMKMLHKKRERDQNDNLS